MLKKLYRFGTNISIRSVNWIGKSNQDPTWKKSETTGKIWRSMKTKKDNVGQRRTKKDKPQHCQRGSAENREKIVKWGFRCKSKKKTWNSKICVFIRDEGPYLHFGG